jgi:3-oxoacyl-[acyl-carrier protein] reductase
MAVAFDFTGRTVLVTGAATGIGRRIAGFFANANAQVWLADVDERSVRAVAERMPGAVAVRCDVRRTDEVQAYVRGALDETGRVDVLVNNAGILRDRVLWKLDDGDWSAVIDVHLSGTFRCTRAVAEPMRKQRSGRIINVTSYTGLHGNVGQSAYAAAKAGIIGFTKTAAKELARYGITVNAVSPNAQTAMVDSIPAERYEALRASIPLGRFAEPAEMAPAVGFLASDEAAYVTGVVLPVDGGLSM